VALYEAGNRDAQREQQAGAALGVAMTAWSNLARRRHLVLGGSFAALEPWLRRPVEQEVGAGCVGRWSRYGSRRACSAATRRSEARPEPARAIYEDPEAWAFVDRKELLVD